ncbi:MAG: thioredoxin family protein [Bacteroidia bacterium]
MFAVAFTSCRKELVDTSLNTLEDVTTASELESAIEKGVTVVFFHATWCSVCEEQRPAVESAAESEDAEGITFLEVDHVDNKSLFKDYDVDGFPQILFFSDGDERERLKGKGHSVEDIISTANKYL